MPPAAAESWGSRTVSNGIKIRAFTATDYNAAYALWSATEGLGLNESDTVQAMASFLDRNPGFSAVATGPDETLVGTILCGHNGRAGSITHLAASPAWTARAILKSGATPCDHRADAS